MILVHSKYTLLFLAITLLCCKTENKVETKNRFTSSDQIVEWIDNPTEDLVMVVAHRGDWRNAPENSIQAVQNCIDMGVEIVEIDVRMTKDSQLVVIHDLILDRTTIGKGVVSEWTLDSIKTLYLRNGAGIKTRHKVPGLEEMLNFIKDRPVLLNLDKAWNYLDLTFDLMKETGTTRQCIFKGNEPLSVMQGKYGELMDSIIYMPMVWPVDYSIYEREEIQTPAEYVQGFIEGLDPLAFEVIYDREDSPVLDAIALMEKSDVSVWVNTLWSELCAGHHDEVAITDPDSHWGWVIDHGANIIQTDRPVMLINYLKTRGLQD